MRSAPTSTPETSIRRSDSTDADDASWCPGAEPREPTLRFVSGDYFEVLRALRFLTV